MSSEPTLRPLIPVIFPQERLEQERREKKKQKEKERKERLKKEGKLLTKAQREARARAEATLKVLQAQGETRRSVLGGVPAETRACLYCGTFCPAGVEVPSKDSMPKKKPVYGDKRKRKPNVHTPEGTPP